MKIAACLPCSKRKVRCDREEPCSNCKRRKQDICTYPDVSSAERIVKLEALVKKLGGTPESNAGEIDNAFEHNEPAADPSLLATQVQEDNLASQEEKRDSHSQCPKCGKDAMVVVEDGQPVYLESFAWHSRMGSHTCKHLESPEDKVHSRAPVPEVVHAGALENMIYRDPMVDLSSRHPHPRLAAAMWSTFHRNVKPLCRIAYDWELSQLYTATTLPEAKRDFTHPEHAFLFALYLIAVLSTPEDEYIKTFELPKNTMLSEFQMLCEQALARSNFLVTSELLTIQALILYIMAGINRLNIRSLWSLMGLVMRNAERLGLHRDGTVLSLPPVEIEKRRRIWWHMQHLDVIMGVKCGLTPLMLLSNWDAKLPLNIEDEDINPTMKQLPRERKGITSMSFCRLVYWVIYEQRSMRRKDGSQLGLTWVADKNMTQEEAEAIVSRLEHGINNIFLQYCDPIRQQDTLVQLFGRSFVTGMTRLITHTMAMKETDPARREALEKKLLDCCMRCLEYQIAFWSTKTLQGFQWRSDGFMQWSAFVYVICEARRQYNRPGVETMWNMLCDVYTHVNELFDFAEDRRRLRAAELVISAWKAREAFLLERNPQQPASDRKPSFVAKLEARLSSLAALRPASPTGAGGPWVPVQSRSQFDAPPSQHQYSNQMNSTQLPSDENSLEDFNLWNPDDTTLNNIDWAFWNTFE